MMSTGFYEENGAKGGAVGGQVVLERYGVRHFAEMGRKGGRPRRQAPAAGAVNTNGEGELHLPPSPGGM